MLAKREEKEAENAGRKRERVGASEVEGERQKDRGLSKKDNLSRCGLVVRRLAGKQKDLGSIRFGSPFSSLQKLWFMDTVL